MKKKLIALIIATALLIMCSCGTENEASVSTDSSDTSTVTEAVQAETDAVETDTANSTDTALSEYFADGDFKNVSKEDADATITLSGSEGIISDTTLGSSGENVTVTAKGVYAVSGTSDGVSIVVCDETESGNIYLLLDGVSMTNSSAPCIYVEKADKVIIRAIGENSLAYTASSAELDGAIYAADDITLNGDGSLDIASSLHGIVGKDDVKVAGSTLNIDASSIGIKANDSVRVGGGTATIDSGHDGIQVSNSNGDPYFYMENGTLTINAGYDGIDVGTDAAEVSSFVLLAGGILDITSGGGSDSSKSDTSQKGIKCDGTITNEGAALNVSSADDAVHSSTDVSISGGTSSLSSSDDGIHADNALSISGGTVVVSKSYEGLEAYEVTISGGDVSIASSDDGINAAGGSDSSSTESIPTFWGESSSTGTLTISGGNLYVNAQGDGLDSNGSLYVTGGTVIVEGPTGSDNGALDIGENGCVASITGGTVLAIGSSGMAVNFNDGSVCSALVSLSGSAGDTITVDDGSGFSFTTSKSFECAVYASENMQSGSTYTISTETSEAVIDFSSSLYYSTVSSMGGGMGSAPGGMR